MPMVKNKSAVATAPAPVADAIAKPAEPNTDSGTKAAVGRLTAPKAEPAAKGGYKPRDFDAEAHGKTRCVQFEAALMSPAIAGMKFKTMGEYLALVREAAEAGVAYTFGEDKK